MFKSTTRNIFYLSLGSIINIIKMHCLQCSCAIKRIFKVTKFVKCFLCVCECIFVCVCVWVCVCVPVYFCVCVLELVCMCLYVCACACACVYVSAFAPL